MRFRDLRAEGWRNLQPCRLEFHPAVNWIHGANGQGKTNLIESLLYLVSGRSHRRARDEDLVAFDAEHFYLSGSLADDGGETLRFSAPGAKGPRSSRGPQCMQRRKGKGPRSSRFPARCSSLTLSKSPLPQGMRGRRSPTH